MRLTSQRRLKLTGRASIAKMSTERQRLSFFLVIIFLAVFGLIVLAEVFFVDKEVLGGKGDFLYDASQQWSGGAGLGLWETTSPLGKNRPAGLISNGGRLHQNLKKHEFEMEKLIKNISARIQSSVAAAAARMNIPPIRSGGSGGAHAPHRYEKFEFERGHGDAIWQAVNGTRHKFYVYSAFYDPRGEGAGKGQGGLVRVIAVTKTKNADKVWCGLRFKSGGNGTKSDVVVKASVWAIRENWNLKYSAAFVLCPLAVGNAESAVDVPVPDAVSVFAAEDGLEGATNLMPVLNRDYEVAKNKMESSSVGVCVKPIHFEYNKTSELIEFFELNRLLGVTHFTLYNDTMSDEVSCVLNRYASSKGIQVSVPEWKLNVASQTEIRTEGLFAALNDCLYRNMLRVQYLALIDFDEFIVPKHNRTLPEMLAFIDREKARGAIPSSGASGISRHGMLAHSMVSSRRITSSYSFQNAFFYLQFPDDLKESKSAPRALKKTRRKAKFNPQKQRSKYICIPRNVREAGNHFIWDFQEGFSLNVPTSVGFLHHYRVCEFGGDDCVQTESVVDRTVADRYKEELTSAIDGVLRETTAAGCISRAGKRTSFA